MNVDQWTVGFVALRARRRIAVVGALSRDREDVARRHQIDCMASDPIDVCPVSNFTEIVQFRSRRGPRPGMERRLLVG